MGSRMREVFYGEPLYHTSYHQQQGARPYSRSQSVYPERARGYLPVLEFRVPMCCEKCQEKVKEEPVQPARHRHGVRGPVSRPEEGEEGEEEIRVFQGRQLHQRKLGPSCFFSGSDITYSGNRMVHNHSYGGGLTRSYSLGRGLGRLPSFGPPATHYNDRFNDLVEPRRDFHGIRRMPSFNRHRHHDAEYIIERSENC